MSHLPLFASSPIVLLTSQTPTLLLEHDEHLEPDGRSHCDDLRQCDGFTQTVTPTSYEPKSHRDQLKTSSPEELSSTETLEQICKDNTSKDPFSQCEQLQRIHTQVKSEYVGTLSTELVTRMQSDKHNNMFNVAANLKHANTHKYTNWRLMSVLCLFVLLCLFSVVLVWFLAHHTVAQASSKGSSLSLLPSHGHSHVSCACWVTLSLSLRPLHLIHFPSLHYL